MSDTQKDLLESIVVVANGSSGIELRVKLSKNYDLREFTLNSEPQPVFISPWMQFEPSEMNDERLRMAHEIAHRVINYKLLLKEITDLKAHIEANHDREERHRNRFDKTIDMWSAERAKNGMPADFKDIEDWPEELKGTYI